MALIDLGHKTVKVAVAFKCNASGGAGGRGKRSSAVFLLPQQKLNDNGTGGVGRACLSLSVPLLGWLRKRMEKGVRFTSRVSVAASGGGGGRRANAAAGAAMGELMGFL